MGSIRWITGFLGWAAGGFIGSLLGYFAGAMAEHGIEFARQMASGNAAGGSSRGPYDNAAGQRNSFMISLLVLSSAVMRADGSVSSRERDHVRRFLQTNFGDAAAADGMRILEELNSKNVDIYAVGAQIAANMNYSQRLQLFNYLAQLANADGEFCAREKSVLESVATAIRINSSDAASVIAMYWRETDSAYTVLGISPSATDDEVKSAYRRMAMKHHPDKVATLGEDVQKDAAKKFRKIQEAYETIKRQRGI